MPTLWPGCTTVPRWRTRICPALTRSPPKTLTPRRLAFESRPFLELPPAFLCAIALALNDIVDAQFRVRLPVALRLLVVLAAAQLEDAHLVGAAVRHDRGLHLGARNERRADLDPVAGADEKHFLERHGAADLGGERLHAHLLARLHPVLLTAGPDNRVHDSCVACVRKDLEL